MNQGIAGSSPVAYPNLLGVVMSAKKKAVRESFRLSVFKRDGGKCKVCGAFTVRLDAHHITDRNELPNGGYVKENGITLCDQPGGCHEKAEVFHSTGKAIQGFHPEDLYRMIGSTREEAEAAASRMK